MSQLIIVLLMIFFKKMWKAIGVKACTFICVACVLSSVKYEGDNNSYLLLVYLAKRSLFCICAMLKLRCL